MLKTFLQDIAVVLCKKRQKKQKTANIRKMRPFWKLPKIATKQTLQLFQNRHFESKIKNAKKIAKNVSKRHRSCSMQKNENIWKMRPYWILEKMATN